MIIFFLPRAPVLPENGYCGAGRRGPISAGSGKAAAVATTRCVGELEFFLGLCTPSIVMLLFSCLVVVAFKLAAVGGADETATLMASRVSFMRRSERASLSMCKIPFVTNVTLVRCFCVDHPHVHCLSSETSPILVNQQIKTPTKSSGPPYTTNLFEIWPMKRQKGQLRKHALIQRLA